MPDIESKLANLAKLIDGQVVSNQVAVQACVKGIVSGFPVTVEAVQANYPFGVSYFMETSHFSSTRIANESFKLTILPKYARGWASIITRFLFFERRGQRIDLPSLDSAFIFKYDNALFAKQFAHYPDVADNIVLLEKLTHFNEMVIKSDAGLYLSQPTSFISLDLDLCQNVLTAMAKLGQVLFEAF
jgi:hypothetical protein